MKTNRNGIASCILTLIVGFVGVNTFAIEFQSGASQTSLLELYTSEGCSSCPPAETWFSNLKHSPQLWTDFVPVAFHVDYWNHLGWRDRWSSKAFSDRQRAYAQSWTSDSIYTPGFVLNGKEWRSWSRSKSIPAAAGRPGILKMISTDLKSWSVSFTPAASSNAAYEAHVALLAIDVASEVKAGENRGRHLDHDFVVLESRDITLKPELKTFSGSASLEIKSATGRNALAVWITESGQLQPLQATGGYVN